MYLKALCGLLSAGLLPAFSAHAETYQWGSVAMGGGGFVSGVVPSKLERGIVYARTDVGGAYRWDARGERWVPLLDWVAEENVGYLGVESIAVDPKNAANVYLMVGTEYSNGGKSAILRSRNYGKTFDITDVTRQFKAHGNGIGRQNGERLQVDAEDSRVLYAGTRADGLFKSTDAGASWKRLASLPVSVTPNGNGVNFVLAAPGRRLFAAVSRTDSAGPNLYTSRDGGASFEPVKGGPAGLLPQRAALAPDGKLYITYANGAGPHPAGAEAMNRGQVWEYDSAAGAGAGSGKWTDVTPAGSQGPFGGISIDAADPRRLVLATINVWQPQGKAKAGAQGDRIYTTRDAGRSWTDVVGRGFAMDTRGKDWIAGSSIHWTGDVQFDPFDSQAAWIVSGNGIFRTTGIDAPTATWRFETAGMEETVPFSVIGLSGGKLATAIGDYDGFLHRSPAHYGARHSPEMGTTTSLVASSDGRVLARSGKAIYSSSDGGASWSKAPALAHAISGGFGQLALSADGRVLLHSPARSSATFRSAIGPISRASAQGAAWTAVSGLDVLEARPVADAVNPQKFYVYDSASGRVLVSKDGGASFAPQARLAAGGSKILAATPGFEGDVWACLAGAGLAHTTDSGASFRKVAGVSACGAVGLGKAAPGASYPTLYMWGTVGGVRGMLRSTDQGASWVRVNDDAHQYGGPGNGQLVAGDMHTYGTVYMTTAGRGIVYGRTAGTDGDVPVTATGTGSAL